MALYILIGVFFCGVGLITGIVASMFFGMLVSSREPPPPIQIEPEILAEMITERMALQDVARKAETTHGQSV